MSRGGFVFIVVALLIGAAIPALLTTTPTRGYPASPHYGNAYVGEFWLEEMNITLDTANSSGYDIAKMVKGHVRAQNDWIVYDPNNSIVANYSIHIGDEHPWFNITMYMEVYAVKSNFSIFVGSAWQSVDCQENRNYNLHGNISVSLSDINFTGGNLTLVCYLKAIIYSKIKFNLNPPKNLTYMVEDRSIVAVEESENTNTDFSWYVDQADKYSPSMWKNIPGIEFQPPEIQENWATEQTVASFVDLGYNVSDNNDPSEDGQSGNVEKKTWYLEYLLIFSDLFNLWSDRNTPLFQRRAVKILDWGVEQPYMKWVVSVKEKRTGKVEGPVKVNFTVIAGRCPAPVFVSWVLTGCHGAGSSVWLWYRLFGKEECRLWSGRDILTVTIPDRIAQNDSITTMPDLRFNGTISVNNRVVDKNRYTLDLFFVNESDGNGNNNTTSYNCYYPTWESIVAYRVIASSPVTVRTVIDDEGATVVRADINSFVKDSNDVFIYTYGADSGNYKIDICG
ncbi:MAG: hypothetical protein DRN18_01960 [Thermoplasmata archaeon]|nr:MAG: hypothetical protein DRN18_01960 [Thermoplasmata archaeon]